MRKIKRHQKTADGEQLELFTITGKPAPSGDSGTVVCRETGDELISRLEKQRALTVNLLEKIVSYENLSKAFHQVRANNGSSGVDGMSTSELREWLGTNMIKLQQQILNEQYTIEAVRQVEIPKPEGGTRKLGIPTAKDRLIQQAIQQEMNRFYEPYFSESSFGFRPGRNAWQAIEQASLFVSEGKEWVVDIDLEKFFDKINHDRLLQRLSKGIGDKRLLRLINGYLKAGIMTDGMMEQRIAGTPQGSPMSPLLSNIILDELDKELEKRGLSFCRYADDCNIYVRSKKAGERVMDSITKFIEQKLKLKINWEKSGVRHCSECKFLGYTLLPQGKIRISDKAIKRLKIKIRHLTKRNRGVRHEMIVKELNSVITGWTNYYHMANCWLSNLRDLDGWIRRKLRCYRLKQCGKKYTTYKLLRSFKISESTSWNVVMYSQGWWEMSNKRAVREAMDLKYFHQIGLQSLLLRIQR